MTYTSRLKVTLDTEWEPSSRYGTYDDEMLPEEHYTFEIPCEDINSTQLFRFFEKVALMMGHNEIGIMKGACALVFNDMRDQKLMREVCDEFELTMEEDLRAKFEDWKKTEEEWARLEKGPMGAVPDPDQPYEVKPGVFVETVTTTEDTSNHPSWEERYWSLYNRFRRFAKFTDEQLEELADHGENIYYMGKD